MLILNWDVKKLQSASEGLTNCNSLQKSVLSDILKIILNAAYKTFEKLVTQKNSLYTFGWIVFITLKFCLFLRKKGGTQLNYKINKHNAGFVLNKRTRKENWCKCQARLSFEN